MAFDVGRAAHRSAKRIIFLLAAVIAMDTSGVRRELSGFRGHHTHSWLRDVPVLDALVGYCSSQPHCVGRLEQRAGLANHTDRRDGPDRLGARLRRVGSVCIAKAKHTRNTERAYLDRVIEGSPYPLLYKLFSGRQTRAAWRLCESRTTPTGEPIIKLRWYAFDTRRTSPKRARRRTGCAAYRRRRGPSSVCESSSIGAVRICA